METRLLWVPQNVRIYRFVVQCISHIEDMSPNLSDPEYYIW